jgi:creatinine amidohydrolase/Fe(II)-dependent formamide hydrolase-like protein
VLCAVRLWSSARGGGAARGAAAAARAHAARALASAAAPAPSPARMVKLEEMRPLEIQDAIRRRVPLLLPVGVLENHGYHNPCGLDLLCARGVSELVAERIEAVVAPPLSYGPGVDAVGAPHMGSLEVGYEVFLPHAQAVLSGLVRMGFGNIVVVCHHQGDSGQEAQCMKLAAANLNLETPNVERPHWWGELDPEEQKSLAAHMPSIRITTTVSGRALRETWAPEYWSVGHGGLHETAAMRGLHPQTVDMEELTSPRTDQPWFGQEEHFGAHPPTRTIMSTSAGHGSQTEAVPLPSLGAGRCDHACTHVRLWFCTGGRHPERRAGGGSLRRCLCIVQRGVRRQAGGRLGCDAGRGGGEIARQPGTQKRLLSA